MDERRAEGRRSALSRDEEARKEGRGERKLATGTWFYDRTVAMEVAIWAKPARLASSRFDDDDQFMEDSPIPETKDGFFYYYWPGRWGEYLTAEEAKAAADAEPWGPIEWD
jgi:hypothetical protein